MPCNTVVSSLPACSIWSKMVLFSKVKKHSTQYNIYNKLCVSTVKSQTRWEKTSAAAAAAAVFCPVRSPTARTSGHLIESFQHLLAEYHFGFEWYWSITLQDGAMHWRSWNVRLYHLPQQHSRPPLFIADRFFRHFPPFLTPHPPSTHAWFIPSIQNSGKLLAN